MARKSTGALGVVAWRTLASLVGPRLCSRLRFPEGGKRKDLLDLFPSSTCKYATIKPLKVHVRRYLGPPGRVQWERSYRSCVLDEIAASTSCSSVTYGKTRLV
ncbi:hypothetical protein EYF80_060049 [Liparis tanakae]|uniref:Uncharacterized protein n=1 Tax=Liparis tanakae TaxID=230148 RepID=A0A4Z2EMV4_9TELE|nr:hypothetical protein EYF80_060049 [Liparis tanakae]